MKAKEQLIKMVIDGKKITDKSEEEQFVFLLSKLEIESKIEAIENYEKKLHPEKSIS